MRYIVLRCAGFAAALLCLANCAVLTSGINPTLSAGPRATSYQATSGLMSFNPVVVFRDQTGSLSLQMGTSKDVQWHTTPRKVSGRSCQYGLSIPFLFSSDRSDPRALMSLSGGWGTGGAARALEDASRNLMSGDVLYDIKVDLNTVKILGVWQEKCIEVNAYVSPAAIKGLASVETTIEHT